MLFALPFAAFGLFVAGMVVRDFSTWMTVQHWAARPAELTHAELVGRHGDDGTTYRVDARYKYEVAGKTYESTRVAVHEGADNIGSYNYDRGRELERLHKARRPVTCFVNPDDPSDAILYRDFRPGFFLFKSLFALVFSGVGFGLIYGGFWSIGHARRTAALQQRYPDEPWKWNEAWRTGRIKSSAGAAAWAVGMFATLWNVISWPVFIGIILQGKLEFGPVLLVVLFPLVGIILGWWAGYLIARRVKWGVSEFEMATIPGVLGGPLAGMIHAPARIATQDGFTLRLACVETVRERSGGKNNSREVTRWDHEKTITRDLSTAGDRTFIPVQFIVPYGLPSSGEDGVKWKLTVEAKTDGVDYHAEFEAPVLETPASSKNPPREVEDASALYAAPPDFVTVASHLGAVLEEDFPDRRTLYFPMARNRGLSIGLVLVSVIWIAVCVGLFISPAPILFPIVFSLFGLLWVPITVVMVLERTRLTFGTRGVTYHRRIVGPGRRHDFAPSDIKQILVDKSGTEANGKPYWKVELRAADNSDHTLATAIASRQVAERLAEEISAAVGLSESRTGDESSRIALEAELPAELRAE
jgi:hypothetical protein